MKKRQIVIVVVAVLILLLAKFGKDFLADPGEKQKPTPKERLVTVFTEKVTLGEKSIEVNTTGVLEAKDRMELFSEVQGLMLPDGGKFKAGTSFSKGQTMLSIRSDDARAAVVAQRSAFERNLSSVMADIRIDYPDSYNSWNAYLKSVDVNASLPELPEIKNSKLKSYLTGRDIFTNFYNVRNAEIGLSRFQIRAPFNGVLTSAEVNPGTVIRPGQLLGIFIKPGVYEVMASTDARTVERLRKGQKVKVLGQNGSQSILQGTVIRVNSSIDPNTQMSNFFVEVRTDELKEGQFVKINVSGEVVDDVYEINRSALKDSRFAFIVVDNLLKLRELEILHTTEKTAIVSGLINGDEVLTQLPPTAFEGMKVQVYSEDAKE